MNEFFSIGFLDFEKKNKVEASVEEIIEFLQKFRFDENQSLVDFFVTNELKKNE